MYLTKSPFQTARVIDRPVLIVAHGSPSDQDGQEIAMAKIAGQFQKLLPDTRVVGATLATKGALERAVQQVENPIICPWFMSDGWFVRTNLPNRLRASGLNAWVATPPLGLMPGIGKLMADRLRRRLVNEGFEPVETRLILAAHGSPSSPRPSLAAEAAAIAIARYITFKNIACCYVDEAPAIRDMACGNGPAVVLPFFAARAGHVLIDLPEELAAARFNGPVLDPVGIWPETPAVAINAIEYVAKKETA